MPSNVENILNGILTGDGSDIQKPASRVEELLFEIYEQGGGGGDSVIGGIKLTIDSNYVMTATLVDKDGEEYGVGDDIDLPLEEMVVDAEYDPQTQKIKLELKNGNYVEFSVAELVSGLQTELSSSNKLNPAYIDYDASHRAVSDTEKSTWDAKQNAISDLAAIRSGASAGASAVQPETMSTALALKQDSLSETQLAAVNSGIDTTKVAQIETNKTNILYSLQTGVKNWMPVDHADLSVEQYLFRNYELALPAGDYIFYLNVSSATATGANFIATNGLDDGTNRTANVVIQPITTGINTANVTVTAGTTHVSLFINGAVNIPEIMLCPKQIWDTINHDFQPFALPNHELTKLESEDRAGLIEVVDKGAKNRLDDIGWMNAVSINNGSKILNNGAITLTASENDCFTYWTESSELPYPKDYKIPVTAGETIIMSWNYTAGNSQTNDKVLIFPNGAISGAVYTTANTNQLVYTIPTNTTFLTFRVGVQTSGNSATYSKIMFCTLAEWKVSQNYVPFALPNYDLTQLEQQDRNALVEVVDEGAKNIFDLHYESDFTSSSKEGLTATLLPDGTISVTGTPTTTEGGRTFIISQYAASYLRKFNGYYMSGSVAPSGNVTETEVVFELAGSPYTRYAVSTNGNLSSLNFPNTNDLVYFYIRIYCANTTTAVNLTFKPMISTKAKLDVSPSYQSYALPNTDLTVLEAEDRAALVEVVDSGAKNKINILGRIDVIKTQNVGGVWSGNSYQQNGITFVLNNDGTISVSGTNSSNNPTNLTIYNSASGIKEFTADNYALSGCPANGSNDSYSIYAYRAKTTNPVVSYQDTGNGVIGYFDYASAESNNSNIAIVIAGNYAISGTLIFKPMICNKAAWDVSPKFVPYRPDYDTLISMINAKEPALSTTTMDNGSLDDITVSSFIVCSWNVSGKPISTMGYVRTSVFDANSAMQEFYSFSGDETQSGLVYVRDKQAGVWRSWKMLTNNT